MHPTPFSPSAGKLCLRSGTVRANNWVIHKISDAGVVGSLKRSVSGIDDSLWDRLPNLAPGQAIVSCAHMQRPVLTSIDPTPAKLRMGESR
jgi:DNA helicase HerA-like ATPase